MIPQRSRLRWHLWVFVVSGSATLLVLAIALALGAQ